MDILTTSPYDGSTTPPLHPTDGFDLLRTVAPAPAWEYALPSGSPSLKDGDYKAFARVRMHLVILPDCSLPRRRGHKGGNGKKEATEDLGKSIRKSKVEDLWQWEMGELWLMSPHRRDADCDRRLRGSLVFLPTLGVIPTRAPIASLAPLLPGSSSKLDKFKISSTKLLRSILPTRAEEEEDGHELDLQLKRKSSRRLSRTSTRMSGIVNSDDEDDLEIDRRKTGNEEDGEVGLYDSMPFPTINSRTPRVLVVPARSILSVHSLLSPSSSSKSKSSKAKKANDMIIVSFGSPSGLPIARQPGEEDGYEREGVAVLEFLTTEGVVGVVREAKAFGERLEGVLADH